jgi:hypothetical protein
MSWHFQSQDSQKHPVCPSRMFDFIVEGLTGCSQTGRNECSISRTGGSLTSGEPKPEVKHWALPYARSCEARRMITGKVLQMFPRRT